MLNLRPTTMITGSHWLSDGYAENIISNTMGKLLTKMHRIWN